MFFFSPFFKSKEAFFFFLKYFYLKKKKTFCFQLFLFLISEKKTLLKTIILFCFFGFLISKEEVCSRQLSFF
jgi:hypothetical protein